MKTIFIQIAIFAGLTAGCGGQRKTGPVGENAVATEPEHRTVEFTEKSASDLSRRETQWQEDGWALNSLSARLPQQDGTLHRRAELTRRLNHIASMQYDDRRISRIVIGETTEDELIEWFSNPDSRAWAVNGRMGLTWSFPTTSASSTNSSGVLKVWLGDGSVESYEANRTKTATAEDPKKSGVQYDDRVISKIGRGETSEAQLLEWFGRPIRRQTRPDHRTQLSWEFASKSAEGLRPAGTLEVSLASDGKVDAYAARRAEN